MKGRDGKGRSRLGGGGRKGQVSRKGERIKTTEVHAFISTILRFEDEVDVSALQARGHNDRERLGKATKARKIGKGVRKRWRRKERGRGWRRVERAIKTRPSGQSVPLSIPLLVGSLLVVVVHVESRGCGSSGRGWLGGRTSSRCGFSSCSFSDFETVVLDLRRHEDEDESSQSFEVSESVGETKDRRRRYSHQQQPRVVSLPAPPSPSA